MNPGSTIPKYRNIATKPPTSPVDMPAGPLEDPAADHGDGYRKEGSHPLIEGRMSRGAKLMEEGDREREGTVNGGSQIIRRSRESSVLQSDVKAAVSATWVGPDGGWGWMVMVSALVISIIVDGLTYTFGLFLGEFETEFDAPKSTVALAGSLQVGVYLMVGPIVSALTNRFGCRPVIIAGSLVSGTSFVVSSFSPNLSVLIVTYGFFGGIGFGMMYLPAIVAVSVYFEKRRALATGIAVCGSGIGTFILAPLTKFLLSEYNWRWTLVILGGFILHAMICGALIRPLEPIIRSIKDSTDHDIDSRPRKFSVQTIPEACEKGSSTHVITPRHRRESFSVTAPNDDTKEMIPLITVTDEMDTTKIVLSQKKKDKDQAPKGNSLSPNRQNNNSAMLFCSVPNIISSSSDRRSSSQAKQPFDNALHSSSVTDISGASTGRARSQTVGILKEVEPKPPKENLPIGLSFIGLSDAQISRIRDDVAVRVSRRDISRSVSLIPQDFNVINQEGFITSIISLNSLTSRDGDIGGGFWNSLKDTLEEMLDFGILKDKRYLFVLLGNFFCMIGFYVPFVYIPERARELGISDDKAAFLISIIGITNIVGRVATGVVVNFLKIDSLLITSLALSTCGIITAVCPLCESYPALIGVSTVFGLGVAAYISLCSILLCELLGVKNLTNAFGFVILFRGVASTVGPPIAGALIDTTGLFDPAFYLGGAMICIGAVSHFMLFIPCMKNLQTEYDKRDN